MVVMTLTGAMMSAEASADRILELVQGCGGVGRVVDSGLGMGVSCV